MTSLLLPSLLRNPRRTLELSTELSVTRDCCRQLIPQVCGVVFCDFRHSCHQRGIFNMLNNFVREWTFPHSVRAFWAISSVIDLNAPAFFWYLHNSRWLTLTKVKIRARRKMKRFLSCVNTEKNACASASITELKAQKARTLWGNVHSCTKLFNMLNIRRWWWHHAVEKSAYTPTVTSDAGHKDRYAYFQATLTLVWSSSLPIWASYRAAFLIKREPYCFENSEWNERILCWWKDWQTLHSAILTNMVSKYCSAPEKQVLPRSCALRMILLIKWGWTSRGRKEPRPSSKTVKFQFRSIKSMNPALNETFKSICSQN